MLTREELEALEDDPEAIDAFRDSLIAMARRALELDEREAAGNVWADEQFAGEDPYEGHEFVLFTRTDGTFASRRLADITGVDAHGQGKRVAAISCSSAAKLNVRGDAAEITMRLAQGDIIDIQDMEVLEAIEAPIDTVEALEQITSEYRCQVRSKANGRLELLVEGRVAQLADRVEKELAKRVAKFQERRQKD